MAFRWIWLNLLWLGLSVQAADPTWHTALSGWTQQLGAWLDARLSGHATPSHNPTTLSIGLLTQYSGLYGSRTEPQVDLRLALPLTQKRFSLILTQELPAVIQDTQGDHYSRNLSAPTGEQATFLGLRRAQRLSQRLWQGLDAGIVNRGLTPGLYARWSQRDAYAVTSTWRRADIREVRWETVRGWLVKAGLHFDHALDRTHLWRLSGEVSARPETRLLQWHLGATLLLKRNQTTSLVVQLLNDWRNQPGGLYRSQLQLIASRPVGYTWSLLSLMSAVRVEQRSNYRVDPVLLLRWSLHFNAPSH